MQPVYVPIAVKNAGMTVKESLPTFLGGPPTLAYAEEISRCYRRMAIGFLFISGIPDELFVHLFHSGRAFLHFLESAGDDEKATSRADPYFDAIACGDDEGARRMARSMRKSWNPRKEYEDDFLYVDFLAEKLHRGGSPTALADRLKRWEIVADGVKDPRLDFCRAIQTVNQTALHASIEGFIETRADILEEDAASGLLHPEDASTTSLVSTELLAWLRIAEAAGLRTQPSYRFAPDVARLLARARHPQPDAWKAIDSYTEIS